LIAANGTQTVYMRTKDALGNISTDYPRTTILDTVAPSVGTGYISSGSIGVNGTAIYYNGNPDIRSDVSDAIGINT
jgi:hypothetical protein